MGRVERRRHDYKFLCQSIGKFLERRRNVEIKLLSVREEPLTVSTSQLVSR